MHNSNFEDIKIIDLAVDKTKQSKKASGLRLMYLELSSSPIRDWITLFKRERQFPRHSMWRDAWVEGKYIVVECAPEEIEKYHLDDLKKDVENSNKKYKDHVAFAKEELSRKKIETERKENEEKERLNKIKGNLNFD